MKLNSRATLFPLWLIFATIAILPTQATAENRDWSLETFGLRAGTDFGAKSFTSVEVFAYANTPYAWQPGRWDLDLKIEANTGMLRSSGDTGFLLSAGPALGISHPNISFLQLFIAGAPTYISEDQYGSTDLGGNFHFTSSLSLRLILSERLSLGYRFQHISNGGIRPSNPGIDLHSLGAIFSF